MSLKQRETHTAHSSHDILNHYVDRYGHAEGYSLALQFCEFMKETEPFPTCLEWCEVVKDINEIMRDERD